MAKALPPGRSSRRALFGFLDADGWGWAGLKAGIWLLIIILLLGYIPDRAYYFTVSRTIDLGLMFWSPVNLCPAENGGLECPAPAGSVVPWQLAPAELDLPGPRSGGIAATIGSTILYAGGTDGTAPSASTFTATISNGTFGAWVSGPDLPAPRSDAGYAVLNGTLYVVGGADAGGKPTTSVWSLAADPESGKLGTWKDLADVTLPEARAGAAVLATADGLLVAGGTGPDGKPSASVWKATVDSTGKLGAFAPQANLSDPVTHASIAQVGSYIWVYGGTDPNGPSGAVQRGFYGAPGATAGASAGPSPAAAASPSPSGAPAPSGVEQWAINNDANAPARSAAAGFAANGAMYMVGGDDSIGPQRQLYWALPDANGDLPGGWRHTDVTDLGTGGLEGAAAVVSGSTVFLIGGTTSSGVQKASIRASLAPQEPFFQLGIAGVVVPALQVPGEIGQQLGYLAAGGAGVLNFVILVALGWVFNHRPIVRAWWDRRRGRATS